MRMGSPCLPCRIIENAIEHPIVMILSQYIALPGVHLAERMVPFTRIYVFPIHSTVIKVDEFDVIVLGNENIGASNVTVHEVATMNDA